MPDYIEIIKQYRSVETEEYENLIYNYIGDIISISNSIIWLLRKIFILNNISLPKSGMLGKHIEKIEKENSKKFYLLKLKDFNEVLNLVKHSMPVMDQKLIKKGNSKLKLMDIETEKIILISKRKRMSNIKLGQELILLLRVEKYHLETNYQK